MHMNRKTIWMAGAAVAAMTVAAGAMAQAKPETLVKQRQAAMTLQGKYFYGQMRPMAQGKVPYDSGTMARNAAFLDALARMPWDGFNPNTKDIKTATMQTAYTEAAKFKEAQDRFMAETSKLAGMVKGGDEGAIKAQVLAIDKSCSGCHESFRERQ
jgi:cytochrome c556